MLGTVTYTVPLLGAGRHTHPRHGGCLLEVVGSLIGGPWTDHPPAMDPLIGRLARSVNDLSSAEERPALVQAAPWLAHLCRDRVRLGRLVVLTAVINASLPLLNDPQRREALLLSQYEVDTPGAGRFASLASNRRRNRSAAHTVSAAAEAVGMAHGDAGLRHLLIDVMTALRRHCELPPVPAMDQPAAHCRVAVPVMGEIHAPGGDGMYCKWTALVEEWPIWMRPVEADTTLSSNEHRT